MQKSDGISKELWKLVQSHVHQLGRHVVPIYQGGGLNISGAACYLRQVRILSSLRQRTSSTLSGLTRASISMYRAGKSSGSQADTCSRTRQTKPDRRR